MNLTDHSLILISWSQLEFPLGSVLPSNAFQMTTRKALKKGGVKNTAQEIEHHFKPATHHNRHTVLISRSREQVVMLIKSMSWQSILHEVTALNPRHYTHDHQTQNANTTYTSLQSAMSQPQTRFHTQSSVKETQRIAPYNPLPAIMALWSTSNGLNHGIWNMYAFSKVQIFAKHSSNHNPSVKWKCF